MELSLHPQRENLRLGLRIIRAQNFSNRKQKAQCQICGHISSRNKDMPRHMKYDKHHLKAWLGMTPHTCRRTHTNDREYQCSVCEKTFKRKDALTSHQNSEYVKVNDFIITEVLTTLVFIQRNRSSNVLSAIKPLHENNLYNSIWSTDKSLIDLMSTDQVNGRRYAGEVHSSCEECNQSFHTERHWKIHEQYDDVTCISSCILRILAVDHITHPQIMSVASQGATRLTSAETVSIDIRGTVSFWAFSSNHLYH